MKSIFLSVVVISALAIAGIGGTLANFSDTEMVKDSAFTTGDLDLMVYDDDSGAYVNDPPIGVGADSTIDITCAWPGKPYRGTFSVQNCGCVDGTLYMHFKNFRCENVDPSHPCANICTAYGTKTEPEWVEEHGGYLDQVWVPGKGLMGDNCNMDEIVYARVWYRGSWVIPWTLLDDLESNWYELGTLDECSVIKTVTIDLQFNDIPDPDWTGNPLFVDHFTNGYQADKITFDVDFGLVSQDP